MKHSLTAAFIILLLCASCSPRHYHGCGFIHNPRFDRFGASYDRENGRLIIKSYIRSEMAFRTEYIYENFDITLPETLETGKEYGVPGPGVALWYANGGQIGQMETTGATGSFIIKERDDDEIILELNLKFRSFKVTGGHFTEIPDSIERSGSLRARKGYKLY